MNFIEFQTKFSTEKSIIKHFCYVRYGSKPACNHCGSLKVYQRSDRPKVFQCGDCTNDFSVFKDTIFENSSTDLRKWFYAIHLFLNGRKGISGLQLQREIDVTYKTAWRMLRQIRLAMGNQSLKGLFENVMEMDETYVGGKPRKGPNGKRDYKVTDKWSKKIPIVGIKDRDNDFVYAKVSVPEKGGRSLSSDELLKILKSVAKEQSTVITDEYGGYCYVSSNNFKHLTINHSKAFSAGDIHTNGIESFWSVLKRGLYGIYHWVSVKHMQHYIDEFCFRHNYRNTDPFDIVLKQSIFY